MPMATLLAAEEHADISGETVREDPAPVLNALRDAGVDIDDVTDTLLREGIDAFVTPMEKLLAGIEAKREAIVTGRPQTIDASLPDELEPAVIETVRRATEEDVARRIWRKDVTLWGPAGQPEVANRLGWLNAPETYEDWIDDLEAFVQQARSDGYTDAALLGMGGSSLAPEVLRLSFGERQHDCLKLHVLDSTDAGALKALERSVDLQRTLFVVSTKSGGTIETRSLMEYFWSLRPHGEQFVVITDPGSSLIETARERGFRRTFLNDPDIGGRYSALSLFGLVPAALMGVDLQTLLDGAGVAAEACAAHDSSAGNSGLWLGATLGALARHPGGPRDKLTFIVGAPIDSFGVWVEQLVAESLGKLGRGVLPVADEPVGRPERYGDDRVFCYLRDADTPDEELDVAVKALADAGHPTITLSSAGPSDLGRIFFFAEFATAVAGWALGVNPFDQPNVQEAKDATDRVLRSGEGAEIADAGEQELRALLADAAPPDYLAIVGFVQPTPQFDDAVAELRRILRDTLRCATTFGYGPRYLHSTGQLHKGGPPTGRFLQLLHRSEPDVAIPGAPYTFETLKRAQADGDLQALRAHGRPAERVRLQGADPAAALRELTARISSMVQMVD